MDQTPNRIKIIESIADSSLSGAPRHLLTLVKGINHDIFDVTILCPPGYLAEEAEKNHLKVITQDVKGFSDRRAISAWKKVFKEEKPQIIHFHGIRAGFVGMLASLNLNVKKVYSEHIYTSEYHLQSRFREFVQVWGLARILASVDAVVVPSYAVKKFLVENIRAKGKKITVIYNGLKDFKVENKVQKNRFGFIGTLNGQKGVSYLIMSVRNLVKKFPDLELEIIGDGPIQEKLELQAKGLERNIKFLGSVPSISDYLSRWQFLVVPSIAEAFGQVVLEASIASIPTVATNVGGLSEIVKNRKTGIVVPAADIHSLSTAIQEMLEHPVIAKKMGKAARALYEKQFTADKMISEFEKLYKNLNETV